MRDLRLAGSAARRAGSQFEKMVDASLDGYFAAGIAEINRLPVPMVPSGIRGSHNEPLFRPSGTSPYDLYGYTIQSEIGLWSHGTVIAAELKCTSNRETSISISDQGLRTHQLASLARVARSGGIARLVWDNCGEYGVLDEEAIIVADQLYHDSLTMKTPTLGTRSIKWSLFTPATLKVVGGMAILDWLYAVKGKLKPAKPSAQSAGTPSP
jgi:penicillin-binding protein-related factor A (putative recombinase)